MQEIPNRIMQYNNDCHSYGNVLEKIVLTTMLCTLADILFAKYVTMYKQIFKLGTCLVS